MHFQPIITSLMQRAQPTTILRVVVSLRSSGVLVKPQFILKKRYYGTSLLETSNSDSSLLTPSKFKASAFTGKADYYEALFFFQDILKRAQSIATPLDGTMIVPWYTLDAMEDKVGFALDKLQYRKLRMALNQLAPYVHILEVRTFLQTFSQVDLDNFIQPTTFDKAAQTEGNDIATLTKNSLSSTSQPQAHLSRSINFGRIDEQGRAISVGRRKSACAKIFLVHGTGECYVNGVPAAGYFKRLHDMFRISDPFYLTGQFGMWNAWCLVKGGGYSGQAGAIAHGLAKALCLQRPSLYYFLKDLAKRDPRVVERKKPGQPKARKRFTWVKR